MFGAGTSVVRHGSTEICFISRTGSTQSRGLWRATRLSRTIKLVLSESHRAEPDRICLNSLGSTRWGTTYKTGVREMLQVTLYQLFSRFDSFTLATTKLRCSQNLSVAHQFSQTNLSGLLIIDIYWTHKERLQI